MGHSIHYKMQVCDYWIGVKILKEIEKEKKTLGIYTDMGKRPMRNGRDGEPVGTWNMTILIDPS